MVLLAGVGLAVGVARLVLRAGAVGLGLDDAAAPAGVVLDRLADLTADALNVASGSKRAEPVARITDAIEQRVATRVAGMPDSVLRADLNGVALEVGGLFMRLADEDWLPAARSSTRRRDSVSE
jgi:hypothetical protein